MSDMIDRVQSESPDNRIVYWGSSSQRAGDKLKSHLMPEQIPIIDLPPHPKLDPSDQDLLNSLKPNIPPVIFDWLQETDERHVSVAPGRDFLIDAQVDRAISQAHYKLRGVIAALFRSFRNFQPFLEAAIVVRDATQLVKVSESDILLYQSHPTAEIISQQEQAETLTKSEYAVIVSAYSVLAVRLPTAVKSDLIHDMTIIYSLTRPMMFSLERWLAMPDSVCRSRSVANLIFFKFDQPVSGWQASSDIFAAKPGGLEFDNSYVRKHLLCGKFNNMVLLSAHETKYMTFPNLIEQISWVPFTELSEIDQQTFEITYRGIVTAEDMRKLCGTTFAHLDYASGRKSASKTLGFHLD